MVYFYVLKLSDSQEEAVYLLRQLGQKVSEDKPSFAHSQ